MLERQLCSLGKTLGLTGVLAALEDHGNASPGHWPPGVHPFRASSEEDGPANTAGDAFTHRGLPCGGTFPGAGTAFEAAPERPRELPARSSFGREAGLGFRGGRPRESHQAPALDVCPLVPGRELRAAQRAPGLCALQPCSPGPPPGCPLCASQGQPGGKERCPLPDAFLGEFSDLCLPRAAFLIREITLNHICLLNTSPSQRKLVRSPKTFLPPRRAGFAGGCCPEEICCGAAAKPTPTVPRQPQLLGG